MTQPKISILVPIYKVEEYLPRCIESVLMQDFTDYELILVDDGSPDRCGEICDEYAAKYPEKIKTVHKENGGAISARLTGFQNAKGKYVMFLDSDDYLLPDALSILYNKIEEGYDIVKCFPLRETEKGEKWEERYNLDEGIIDQDLYIKGLIHIGMSPYLHSSIYRADLFDYDMFQKEIDNDISIGDDWIINFMIASKVNKVAFITRSLYVYFINTGSMMHQKVKSWEYQDRISNITKAYREQLSEGNKQLSKQNRFGTLIKYFFIPELKFRKDKYIKARDLYKENKEFVRNTVDKKYLRFIENRLLFYIYTRLFCFLFFAIKLKFKKRKVIK